MNTALLKTIEMIEKRLTKRGYVFYPKTPQERLVEINEFFSKTNTILNDKEIEYALSSIAIDDSFVS